MAADRVSRGSRRFVLAGATFLVGWRLLEFTDVGPSGFVVVGLYGFLFHTLFGKAYALVPAYFDRSLAFPRAPAVQWPLSVAGTLLLALGYTLIGGVLWIGGVAVFLGALGWTLRDNPLGRETGTSEASADRRPVDRAANATIPVVLVYLAAGSYSTLALATGLPGPPMAATSHLLAAGTLALAVFAVGFRLLPRFLVAHPPRVLVVTVLTAGALGPALLVAGFPAGGLFRAGAAIEAVAVVGFALVYTVLFVRSDRKRVGLYSVLAGVWFGVVGVALGAWFAFVGLDAGLTAAHYRVNLLGFLGLVVVGVAYQFYPPGVGAYPGIDDRTAAGSIVMLAGGVCFSAVGHARWAALTPAGDALSLVGAVAYAGILVALFHQRHGRRAV